MQESTRICNPDWYSLTCTSLSASTKVYSILQSIVGFFFDTMEKKTRWTTINIWSSDVRFDFSCWNSRSFSVLSLIETDQNKCLMINCKLAYFLCVRLHDKKKQKKAGREDRTRLILFGFFFNFRDYR